MALTLNQINAITEKKFIPKMHDNIFDSIALFSRMKKGESYKKIDGGEKIVVPLEYAQTSASGTYSGADTLSTADNEVFTGAQYDWKQYFANISITGIDKLKNSGEAQVIDFVKAKVKNAERTLADKLAEGLYSAGTDAKALLGLRVVGANSNSVGGISQTDYSWWRTQRDATTTALTMPFLKDLYEDAVVDGNGPSVIVSNRALHNAYWNMLQPQQRFVDSDTAKAGFANLMFQGKPWIVDHKCPASHLIMIDEKFMFLAVHKECDMKFLPFVRPINQDVESAKVLWAGALCYSNLRHISFANALTG
jgi:hypothetical protein